MSTKSNNRVRLHNPICRSSAALWFGLLVLTMHISPTFAAHKPIHVVFINPGHANNDNPTGHFWPEASRFANAVADDLKIQLETLYAERDSFRLQTLLKAVLERDRRPDYLLLVNERFALTPLFDEIDDARIPFFLAYNHHSKRDFNDQPKPRKHHKFWLGALLPDNEYAGYRLAKLLIDRRRQSPAQILAFRGDTVTSASLQREHGLKRALEEHPTARLVRTITGEWRYDIAEKTTPGILKRQPQINSIWAANGPMGLGALKSITQRSPNIQVASINWDTNEIEALENGQLYASVGGHFMTAGWSLILLHDYHHGHDFVFDGGAYQRRKIFEAVTRDNIEAYLPVLKTRNWHTLDFKAMSKHFNPALKEYHFSLGALLKKRSSLPPNVFHRNTHRFTPSGSAVNFNTVCVLVRFPKNPWCIFTPRLVASCDCSASLKYR